MHEGTAVEEPRLTVKRQRSIVRRRPRFTAAVAGLLALFLAGTTSLALSGHLLLPFDKVLLLEGRTGSKAAFFEDPEVQRLLLRHGIRVHVTASGSQELVNGDYSRLAFLLPSGRPPANDILARLKRENGYSKAYNPFVSPLVLATYRDYARTLEDNGIATPQYPTGRGEEPLYYSLDLAAFLQQGATHRSWNDLRIDRHGTTNGNVVVAQTSHICQSNSAETFLAQVAFTENGGRVPEGPGADELADRIKPLLSAQGMPGVDVFEPYASPEGRGIAPVVVVYEHQYLAYQTRFQDTRHRLDTERVLLYPTSRFITQPQYISLRPEADRLGELLTHDRRLRERAVALGFRTIGDDTDSGELRTYLGARGIPAPDTRTDDTRTVMPTQEILNRMVRRVGDCPADPGTPAPGATP
ncbi:hypothetical protein SAMN05216371_7204 [Streptomyces sp. TLI_053]|uniref:hypothetical protein n=1 Tax=Streptomyces sp. TLI_053 TaxID=1855352 RepID=UPI00087BAC9F|nr:hypothetical protein [Streptomyces sp. TLI_053]SDT82419.1 hypothetical protein SAMN05216371_7204 [Streptomyces sp. TLI_053]